MRVNRSSSKLMKIIDEREIGHKGRLERLGLDKLLKTNVRLKMG